MTATKRQEVRLSVFADEAFLPLATSFAEKSATAFGLDETDALALTLATEEIFVHLCKTGATGTEVEMICRRGVYYVEEEFCFTADDFDMKAFNLTTAPAFHDEADFEETGLLIASRMVDRFRFSESEQGLRLILVKDKTYPEIDEERVPAATRLARFAVRSPDPEELKALLRLVNSHYAPHLVPVQFRFPGKIVDMVRTGDAGAAIAVDGAGHIGGGIFWRGLGQATVICSGPYLFNQPQGSEMAHALVEECIAALGRTPALGVYVPRPTPELPGDYFEVLGDLTVGLSDGSSSQVAVYYRHLQEDLGDSVWAHPLIESFLVGEYGRLAFVREIKPVRESGETPSPFSVLATDFDRQAATVRLRPVRWGSDMPRTIASHVEIVSRDGVQVILFVIDLGIPWHSHFVPALLDNGFQPRLVFPYAGKKDLVVFEHSAAARQS